MGNINGSQETAPKKTKLTGDRPASENIGAATI